MRRAVVVTGVSSGIGLATARTLARRGFVVFGTVRRASDAAPLVPLGDAFRPLVLDVTDVEALRAAARDVAGALGRERLSGLVNNAGIGLAGPLELLPLDDLRRQLEVNVVGPVAAAQAFLPLLGTDPARSGPPGRIVNVSSVAGRTAPPFMGAYAASKHALEAISESLRRELMPFGIAVAIVAPGSVATPIWEKAEAADLSPLAGTAYDGPTRRFRAYMLRTGRAGLSPERVAAVIATALTARRPRVRYAVVQHPLRDAALPALLPRRMIDRAIAKGLGLLPPRRRR